MLGYLSWLTLREQDCPDEPGSDPEVIDLVKLGHVEDTLGDDLSLHCQVDNLQLDWHLLGTECLGHLLQDIWGMEGDPLTVLPYHPDTSSLCSRLLQGVQQLGHLDDDVLVLSLLFLEQLLNFQDTTVGSLLEKI